MYGKTMDTTQSSSPAPSSVGSIEMMDTAGDENSGSENEASHNKDSIVGHNDNEASKSNNNNGNRQHSVKINSVEQSSDHHHRNKSNRNRHQPLIRRLQEAGLRSSERMASQKSLRHFLSKEVLPNADHYRHRLSFPSG